MCTYRGIYSINTQSIKYIWIEICFLWLSRQFHFTVCPQQLLFSQQQRIFSLLLFSFVVVFLLLRACLIGKRSGTSCDRCRVWPHYWANLYYENRQNQKNNFSDVIDANGGPSIETDNCLLKNVLKRTVFFIRSILSSVAILEDGE